MRLSQCLVILGIDNNIKIDSVFYSVLLLAKQYLYRCKIESLQPDIVAFKRKLIYRYRIEYNSKIKNDASELYRDILIN